MSRNTVFFHKFVNNCKKYNDEGIYSMLFPWTLLFVYGVEAVKFFSNEANSTSKPTRFYQFIDIINSNSLFRSNGETMKKRRKLIGPAFYPKVLKDVADVVNEHAAYVTEEVEQLDNYTTNDLNKIMQLRIALLFFGTSLGMKKESLGNTDDLMRILENVSEYIDYAMHRMFHPWLYFNFVLLISHEGRKQLKRKEEIKHFIHKVTGNLLNIHNSRTHSMNHENEDLRLDNSHHKSFAEILVEAYAVDPSFRLEDLKSELMTLIFGESLRLYPIAPIFLRNSSKDIQFEKYTIDSGTTIAFLPYVLHRNADLYPNPEVFNPDRFVESNSNLMPWAHIPFAEGVRSCIGKNYAMLVMKVFLAHIIRNFRLLSLSQKEDIGITWSMTLRSSKPISMKFIPR